MFRPMWCSPPGLPTALTGEWGGLLFRAEQVTPGLHAAIYARTYWDPIIFVSHPFKAWCVCGRDHRFAHVRRTGPVQLRTWPAKSELLKIRDTLRLTDYGIVTAGHGWNESRKACIIAFDW